jgi:hypothetical protein
MNQFAYFNILGDQLLPFSQHLQNECAIDIPNFPDDNSKVLRAKRICDWLCLITVHHKAITTVFPMNLRRAMVERCHLVL